MQHTGFVARRCRRLGRLGRGLGTGIGAAICGFVLTSLAAGEPAHAAVDRVCDKRFAIQGAGDSLELVYCGNKDLALGDAQVTRAIVVVHGMNRNADDYAKYVEDAGVLAENSDLTTAIIAPQFLAQSDIDSHELPDDVLFWASSGWKKGNTSRSTATNPRPFTISSFEVLDLIVKRLADPEAYPRIGEVIVTGHSAGGQFTNRYAAGGSAQAFFAALRPDLSFRYVVANPSSYLYFSPERASDGIASSFAIPDSGSCPGYDDYHYGLRGLNLYMSAVGAAVIQQRYRSRRVAILLGSNDDDPHHSSLAVGCAAMLQGDHRLERGQIYFNHVYDHFGDGILERHSLDLVLEVGHSARRMYQSDCGLLHLYDFGPGEADCPRQPVDEPRDELPSADFDYSPASPETGQSVSFSHTPSDGDGTITAWWWEFGDGSTSTARNPVRSFTTPGDYLVVLTVKDDAGATSTATRKLSVTSSAIERVAFGEGFEDGLASWMQDSNDDWFVSGQRARDGMWSAEVRGRAKHSALISPVVDLRSATEVSVAFSWYIEGSLDRGDFVAFDISTDGGASWVEKARLRGNRDRENVWHDVHLDLTGLESLVLRFRGKTSRPDEAANIDAVTVRARSR